MDMPVKDGDDYGVHHQNAAGSYYRGFSLSESQSGAVTDSRVLTDLSMNVERRRS